VLLLTCWRKNDYVAPVLAGASLVALPKPSGGVRPLLGRFSADSQASASWRRFGQTPARFSEVPARSVTQAPPQTGFRKSTEAPSCQQ
jgi:hypothetical protein